MKNGSAGGKGKLLFIVKSEGELPEILAFICVECSFGHDFFGKSEEGVFCNPSAFA